MTLLVSLAKRYAVAVSILVTWVPLECAGAQRTPTPDVLSLVPAPIRFSVKEATWSSLDVSPDGKTIVFDLLGDLYTLPITGGRARRITTGSAVDVQPRFSPSGEEIVFSSDRSGGSDLWIFRRRDGALRRLVSNTRPYEAFRSPEWAPSGREVFATRQFDADELVAVNVVDGTLRVLPLTSERGAPSVLGAAFGPRDDSLFTVSGGREIGSGGLSPSTPALGAARWWRRCREAR